MFFIIIMLLLFMWSMIKVLFPISLLLFVVMYVLDVYKNRPVGRLIKAFIVMWVLMIGVIMLLPLRIKEGAKTAGTVCRDICIGIKSNYSCREYKTSQGQYQTCSHSCRGYAINTCKDLRYQFIGDPFSL